MGSLKYFFVHLFVSAKTFMMTVFMIKIELGNLYVTKHEIFHHKLNKEHETINERKKLKQERQEINQLIIKLKFQTFEITLDQ